MCLTCKCGMPNEGHGDHRHLTLPTLKAAADAAGISPRQAAENILTTLTASKEVYSGKVLKASDEHRFLLTVAYSPNRLPYRGADGFIDIVRPEVLEKACWKFMDNGAKVGLWHEPGHEDSARVVENYVYRNPIPWVFKAANGEEVTVREGDWVVGMILDKPTWALYKARKIGGSSPQGGAARQVASPETLAYVRSN